MPLPLSETVVAGQAGHISAHNDIHDVVNEAYRKFDAYADAVVDFGLSTANTGAANRVVLQSAITAVQGTGVPLYIPGNPSGSPYKLAFDSTNNKLTIADDLVIFGPGSDLCHFEIEPRATLTVANGGFSFYCFDCATIGKRLHFEGIHFDGPATHQLNLTADNALFRYQTSNTSTAVFSFATYRDLRVTGWFSNVGEHSYRSNGRVEIYDCDMQAVSKCASNFDSTNTYFDKHIRVFGGRYRSGTNAADEPDAQDHGIIFYIHPHIATHIEGCHFVGNHRAALKQFSGGAATGNAPKYSVYKNLTFEDCDDALIETSGENETTSISGIRADKGKILVRNDCVISDVVCNGVVPQSIGAFPTYTVRLSEAIITSASGNDSLSTDSGTDVSNWEINDVEIRVKGTLGIGFHPVTVKSSGYVRARHLRITTAGASVRPDYGVFIVPVEGAHYDLADVRFEVASTEQFGVACVNMFGEASPTTPNCVVEISDFDFRKVDLAQKAFHANNNVNAKIRGGGNRFGARTQPTWISSGTITSWLNVWPGLNSSATASAATLLLSPDYDTHHISGTTTISNLYIANSDSRVTQWWAPKVQLIADAAWSTASSGNIRPRLTAVRTVNEAYAFQYDPVAALWYEVGPKVESTVTGTMFRSTYYYATLASISTLVCAADRMYATPLKVDQAGTLDRIGIAITGAGTAGSVVRLGFYSDDGTGRPGNLILDAGTVDGTAAATPEITISQAVSAGWLWLVAVGQGSPSTQPTVRANNTSVAPVGGTSASTVAGAASVGYHQNSVTGALPASWSSWGTQFSVPRPIVRAA